MKYEPPDFITLKFQVSGARVQVSGVWKEVVPDVFKDEDFSM